MASQPEMSEQERSLIKDQMLYRLLSRLSDVAPNHAEDMAEQIDFALYGGTVREEHRTKSIRRGKSTQTQTKNMKFGFSGEGGEEEIIENT